ncbi:MAG TPA: hypothetical protein VF676_03255 [Flavobacterium sp.]
MIWKAKIITHNGEPRIAVVGEYHPKMTAYIRDFKMRDGATDESSGTFQIRMRTTGSCVI